MSDIYSLIAVTSLLAIGGLGLFIYKSSDEVNNETNVKNNEDDLFGFENIWGNSYEEEDGKLEETKIKPKCSHVKTKRNRKGNGTKRRY